MYKNCFISFLFFFYFFFNKLIFKILVENVPGFGFKEVNGNKLVNQELSITYQESNQSYIMRNSYVTVTFDNIGRIISFIDNEIK